MTSKRHAWIHDWLLTRSKGQGLSMVIFQSEENARQAADQVQANMPPGDAVTFESAEVREVVAQA
jgi:hypothetical protein